MLSHPRSFATIQKMDHQNIFGAPFRKNTYSFTTQFYSHSVPPCNKIFWVRDLLDDFLIKPIYCNKLKSSLQWCIWRNHSHENGLLFWYRCSIQENKSRHKGNFDSVVEPNFTLPPIFKGTNVENCFFFNLKMLSSIGNVPLSFRSLFLAHTDQFGKNAHCSFRLQLFLPPLKYPQNYYNNLPYVNLCQSMNPVGISKWMSFQVWIAVLFYHLTWCSDFRLKTLCKTILGLKS